jgi:hypothetical protein
MGRWRAYAHSILADFHPSSMGEGEIILRVSVVAGVACAPGVCFRK